jgi:hypothetical protein
MLVEISEKFNTRGSGLSAMPVEFRLAITILFSAATYSLVSVLSKKLNIPKESIQSIVDALGNRNAVKKTSETTPNPVPEPIPQTGGLNNILGSLGNLDMGQLLNMAGSLLGGQNNNSAPRGQRRVPHSE